MKNEKIIKKGIFTTLVFVVCLVLFGALALNNTQKKVKADPISYYYAELDDAQENYATIIVYIWDAFTLVDNTAPVSLYGATSANEYTTIEIKDAEFLRYSAYDYMDYDAYIYSWSYSNISANYTALFLYFSWYELHVDSVDVVMDGAFASPYPPTFKLYYENGYNDGYANGYGRGYDAGQTDGYYDGYDDGYDEGYQDGIDAEIGTANWFVSSFEAVDSFLNIHIFPNITFGVLLGIPFVIEVVWFIIRQFRGGGGD